MRNPACQKHVESFLLARCTMQANFIHLHLVITVLKLVFASVTCAFLATRRWHLLWSTNELPWLRCYARLSFQRGPSRENANVHLIRPETHLWLRNSRHAPRSWAFLWKCHPAHDESQSVRPSGHEMDNILDNDELFWLLSTYVCSGPFGCIFISEGWGTHDSMIFVYWYCIGSKENHKSPRYIVSHSWKLQYFPLVKSWHRFSTLNADSFYDDLWWSLILPQSPPLDGSEPNDGSRPKRSY